MRNIWYYTRLLWVRSMKAGAATGCHQLPERSFFFRQYQFPVCARCCGVLVGESLAIITAAKKVTIRPEISLLAAETMFLDWFMQNTGKLESTNARRFVSGILGGFGCWSLEIAAVKRILKHNK